jgi:hypothetical protein
MNVPFTAVHFASYETVKRLLAAEDDENLMTQLVAGGTAGGLSAACTNPLDVVKTRLQTDGTLRQHRGVKSSAVVCSVSCSCSRKFVCDCAAFCILPTCVAMFLECVQSPRTAIRRAQSTDM